MTTTAFLGLVALGGGLGMMATWLQLRRASTDERRKKRADFHMSIVISTGFLGFFALNFLVPMPVPPSSLEATCISLWFLLILGLTLNELRVALKAKRANTHDSPSDRDR